ncbi:hypothetical protein [Actinokineospora sp. UTMC 2448]|uniref:hypothetical protein n=1 Tax=Actinokineospora sp. UTMC 2448 TaxID=2268449 RepID=UPI002164CDD4|nr:hypothetical protein [Actinokineospora sp. UTMC 2448]UVS78376.1 DnaJ central domain protein [Actinokineospora sp. UTMC 2448]
MTMLLGSVLDLTEPYDTCNACNGGGLIAVTDRTRPHVVLGIETCGVCRGAGLTRLCGDCDGHGHTPDGPETACWGCDGAGEVP